MTADRVLLPLAAALALAAGLAACRANGEPAPPNPAEEAPSARAGAQKERVVKSEAEWKKILTPEQYRILREKGTERAFTGEYYETKTPGTYVCAGCGLPLFSSDHKYRSGSGWPSFYKPIDGAAVDTETDTAYGMRRTEILCARCGGHLGHVFEDGPEPTGLRYCVNSASLALKPDGAARTGDDTE